MLKKTPLYDTHLACGAKTIDFGGWDMPLHYGSQLDEHHAVRRGAGMFDVSHMLAVDLEGAGTSDYLRRLLANDVDRLKTPGKALYSCMLNDAGGVIDDLIAYRLADERFRIVVNAGTAQKDIEWMRARGGRPRQRRELAIVAVQGPEARGKLWAVRPQWRNEALAPFVAAEYGPVTVARTGYTGEDGLEIILPAGDAAALWNDLKAAGVAPCGLGARDTLRLEAGMNLYGNDMDENVSPLDAGLAWTVALTPGRDFIGRAALESRGQTRAFLGLKLAERGVMRTRMRVVTRRGDGEITSGSFSPTMNLSIALARLPLETAPGETAQVEMRGKLVPATIVKPPFVRNGKILS
ncbi:MAG: glycine cleavage system aminomethyltransferase GcvT [Betaproteobacteria bacterium]|nr:glycine cleavage system aminomethyltransferase GcvT [Betaproteobacteria bacterium]